MGDDSAKSSQAMQVTSSSNSLDHVVDEIEELAGRLIQTVEFTEDLQDSFQHLAKSLVDLERERHQLHDKLEVQTINASVKRHALRNLPEEFQKQLESAVLAARNGNSSTIKSLQSQMNVTTEATRETLTKQQVLQKENAKYLPERDIVTRQHDELIAALNQRMADKASRQIKLNETKDQLRETTSSVKEFDLGMKNLNDDMKEFFEETSTEQAQLEAEILKTQDAIKCQKEKNAEVKGETDQVMDKIVEMNTRLDIVLKDVRRTENSKARLELQSIQLKETIKRGKLLNQDTTEEVVVLEATKERQNQGYLQKTQEMELKINKVLAEYEHVDETHKQLSKEKDEIFLKKEEVYRKKSKAQASVREKGREVQVIKQKTTGFIEKSAKISQENNQYHDDMQALDENHTVTIETFNQQITDYQSNLDVETTEKKKVQDEQEHTEKVLDDFRSEQVRFMNEMTQKIEQGRMEHKLLAQQSSKFNQSVASNVKKSGKLRVDIEMAQKNMALMKDEISMEIERLKTSIELCQAENVKKETYLKQKRPVVENLENELEDIGEEYARLKNEVVAVRNRQKSIQEQLHRAQTLVQKLDKPYHKLKEDLKSCRIDQLVQITGCAQQMKKRDTEIYECTKTMENVIDENTRFVSSCREKEEVIDDINQDIKSHGSYQGSLINKLRQLQASFMDAWNVCETMEIQSAENDARLLESIKTLQKETKDRCDLLTSISENLVTEMDALTGFLDNVNSRRPQDTRQSKRVSIKPTPPPPRPSLVAKHRKKSSAFKSQSRKSISLPPGTSSQPTITAR